MLNVRFLCIKIFLAHIPVGVRMLFSSFPPLATYESEDPQSRRLLKLSGSAIRMAGRLTQPEFNKVRGDIKHGLSAMAEYLSPSRIESVTSRMDWFLLYMFLDALRAFPDPGLIPEEAVDALARCTSRLCSNPETVAQTSFIREVDKFPQVPKLMEELRQKVEQSHNKFVSLRLSYFSLLIL